MTEKNGVLQFNMRKNNINCFFRLKYVSFLGVLTWVESYVKTSLFRGATSTSFKKFKNGGIFTSGEDGFHCLREQF